jgi:hypothetical protein
MIPCLLTGHPCHGHPPSSSHVCACVRPHHGPHGICHVSASDACSHVHCAHVRVHVCSRRYVYTHTLFMDINFFLFALYPDTAWLQAFLFDCSGICFLVRCLWSYLLSVIYVKHLSCFLVQVHQAACTLAQRQWCHSLWDPQ